MSMEKEKDQKTKPVKYYGKKGYRIHLLLARPKVRESKLPNYRQEDIDEHSSQKSDG